MPKSTTGPITKRARRKRIAPDTEPNFPGQHFLHNPHVIRHMLAIANSDRQPIVMDIGAGAGALTLPLATAGWQVLAVENDRRMAEKLRRRTRGLPQVRVIERDFLQMKLPQQPFAVVANIPFSITTPILGRLMDHPASQFQRAVLITELAAARRFTRRRITTPRLLLWRMFFRLRLVRYLEPQCFSPPPGVSAALLTVERDPDQLLDPAEQVRFLGLASHCLRAPELPIPLALHQVFTHTQIKHLLHDLGEQHDCLICDLRTEQWAMIHQAMRRFVPPHRWPRSVKPKWSR